MTVIERCLTEFDWAGETRVCALRAGHDGRHNGYPTGSSHGTLLAELRNARGAVDLLATFVDDEPCRLDHHGYCQTHGWLQEGECNVARARRLIGGR